MNKRISTSVLIAFILAVNSGSLYAQNDVKPTAVVSQMTDDQKAKSDAEQEKKAAEWASSLNLNDAAKEGRVKAAVLAHLKAVRDWHNEHPFSTVPARTNSAIDNTLSDLDSLVIANSAIPRS